MIKRILSKKPLVIAGPCAVESQNQITKIAKELNKIGINIMRTQLWKPRSKADSFQGVGLKGLSWLKKIKNDFNMILACEVVLPEQIKQTKGVIDILWVGSRNMQNFELLKALSNDPRPVILKRGFIATINEWISSADYIGREKVIMCERGIRTGADSTRFTLDINTALVLKHDYKMPVIIDPSHSAGRRDLVPNLARAAIASGIDGIVIEVHNHPEKALSDKKQQLLLSSFKPLFQSLKKLHHEVI